MSKESPLLCYAINNLVYSLMPNYITLKLVASYVNGIVLPVTRSYYINDICLLVSIKIVLPIAKLQQNLQIKNVYVH